MSSNTKKLAVLAARTDHDLVILVSRELDRSFALANVATTKGSPLFLQALRAYDTATALLAKISILNPNDRFLIEAKMKEVRSLLDQVPAYAAMRAYPASCAS